MKPIASAPISKLTRCNVMYALKVLLQRLLAYDYLSGGWFIREDDGGQPLYEGKLDIKNFPLNVKSISTLSTNGST